VSRTASSVSSLFSYAGVELDPVLVGSSKYLRGPSGASVYGVVRGGVTSFAGADRHGDVSFSLTAAGAVSDSTIRDPFGKTLGSTGTAPDVGFQSDWTDPVSGLVWMGARWYQPNTGTFVSRDTVAGSVGAYASMNRFTYGLNNPVLFNDPTGRVAAPAGCDNACQSEYFQRTGDFYDADTSFNDRYQNGDRDAQSWASEDGQTIMVINDVGMTVSVGQTIDRHTFDELANQPLPAASVPVENDPASNRGTGTNRGVVTHGSDSGGIYNKNSDCAFGGSGVTNSPEDKRACDKTKDPERKKQEEAADARAKAATPSISPKLSAKQWQTVFDLYFRLARTGVIAEMIENEESPSSGSCYGVVASFFYSVEGSICQVKADGKSATTKTIGYSIGPQWGAAAGPSTFISNAQTIEENVGWNACVNVSTAVSIQFCQSIEFDAATGKTTVSADPRNQVWSMAGSGDWQSGKIAPGVKGTGGASIGITLTCQVRKKEDPCGTGN
jgi:RHS repeat-associated protein